MAAATRPLTLGEILDRTIQLYRRNFLLYFGISILPAALYVALSGSVSLYYTSKLPAIQQSPQTAGPAMLLFGLIVVLFLFIGVPILLAISALSFSALNFAANDSNRGETVTIRSSYARSFSRFWRFMGIVSLQVLLAAVAPGIAVFIVAVLGGILTALASRAGGGPALAILLGLSIFGLAFAAIVVFVLIWIRYCLAFTASIVEDKRPWPSMQRSAQLTKGTRGRIFVMYLLVLLLTLVAYYALILPIDIVLKLTVYKSLAAFALLTKPPVVLQIINLVISCLERALVLPIYAIALLLFYNDQRTRMEGYDIEQLMEQAGWSELAPAPPVPFALTEPPVPPPPTFGRPAAEPPDPEATGA